MRILVVLPLLIFRTTFWPFLSALLERSVSVALRLLLVLETAPVVLPWRRIVPVNFVVELEETVQEIDFLLEASLQVAL